MQRVVRAADIVDLKFQDGVAALTCPIAMLAHLPIKNAEREPSPRLDAVTRSIRNHGYTAEQPIVCRIGRKGRWIVVNGGHRLTALRRINASCWRRLVGPMRGEVYFLLFETARSWKKTGRPEGADRAG
jgi:hypothetical protein